MRARLIALAAFLLAAIPARAEGAFLSGFDFTWRDLSEVGSIGLLVWFIIWLLVKPKIAADFVTKAVYSEQIGKVNERLDEIEEAAKEAGKDLDARLSRAEVHLDTLPDKDNFHQLALEIKEQAGDLKGISATVKPLAQAVQRIEQHLMDGKK